MNSNAAYVLVTPARNEQATIESTILSVVRQTTPPKEWIIVSDGSTDQTDDIVRRYASAFPYIKLLRLEARPSRNFASVVFALEAGLAALQCTDSEYIGLIDADVRFPPNYYEQLMLKFSQHPQLGLAGGLVLDLVNGRLIHGRNNLDEVAGATQFFTRKCFVSLNGLIAIKEGGWDALTCVCARMNGYAVHSFPDLIMEHLKPRNAAFGSPLQRKWQMGQRDYALAYHPAYEFSKCVSRVWEAPLILGAISWFLGYCWAVCGRRQQTLPIKLVRFIRQEQRIKLAQLLRFRRTAVNSFSEAC